MAGQRMSGPTRSTMRTSIARAATAAIALAVAGGPNLAAATHAAAATPSYTCTSLVLVAPQPS